MTRPHGARWPLIAPEASYTVSVAAALSGVTPAALVEEIVAGRLPFTMSERGRRIAGADLLAWMERERLRDDPMADR